jgi:polyhydroxyalkanoate synthase
MGAGTSETSLRLEGQDMQTDKGSETSSNAADALALGASDNVLGPNPFIGWRAGDAFAALREILLAAASNPALLVEQEAALVGALVDVLLGRAKEDPTANDRRFQDDAWKSNPYYKRAAQSYRVVGDALYSFVDRSPLPSPIKGQAKYLLSLCTDALSPANTLLGNPVALKRMIDTGGGSVVDGLRHMLHDAVGNGGMPSQVDRSAFAPGRNLALSPGAVVFRNPVLELIQYRPSTPDVHARPHLIVPPQINKYYVFDLSPGRSIVEFLVAGGMQTFVVSWRNPTPNERDWDMDTYVQALLDALEAIREITGSDELLLHGACSGAMTMSALLGHLAAKGRSDVSAATLMVAVLEIGAESQLGLFATPPAIAAAKSASSLRGVLSGEEMGRVFAWMRPNELVWNYWINNYLMGRSPPAFDVLYWNSDSTRLPARFHAQLLDVFHDRLLARPGAMNVLGTPIDLSEVTCDMYVVAGATDHITPWKDVHRAARAFGGRTEFVLCSSGHVQSLVNPPGNAKAKYFVNAQLAAEPEPWLASATAVNGSWWTHWREWLALRSGPMVAAPRELGSVRHRSLNEAPGTYVFGP